MMATIVIVPKIGTGTGTGIDSVRPDTTAISWVVIEERATEFVIEILD